MFDALVVGARRDLELTTRRGIALTLEALCAVRAARAPLHRDARPVAPLERATGLLDDARIALAQAIAADMLER